MKSGRHVHLDKMRDHHEMSRSKHGKFYFKQFLSQRIPCQIILWKSQNVHVRHSVYFTSSNIRILQIDQIVKVKFINRRVPSFPNDNYPSFSSR